MIVVDMLDILIISLYLYNFRRCQPEPGAKSLTGYPTTTLTDVSDIYKELEAPQYLEDNVLMHC